MAFPADARRRKLTRQFPNEEIWKLIEQGRIRDVAGWLREEIAARNWDYETAENALDADRAHLWRIVHGKNGLSQHRVTLFAVKFGHVFDENGALTTDKIEYLVARLDRRRARDD
jgi:hypothetical protein